MIGRSCWKSAAQPGRAVDVQRALAGAQVERLEHPDQPEPVVEVEVRDEDRVHVGQPDRAQQLLLGPLAAVEQDPVAAGAQQQRRQPAAGRRHRAGRAGEEEAQIHGVEAYVRAGASPRVIRTEADSSDPAPPRKTPLIGGTSA